MNDFKWRGSGLANNVGVSKESAGTKLYQFFQDKTLKGRQAKEAQARRSTLIQQGLSAHWACKNLSQEKKLALEAAVIEKVFAPGSTICQAGDRGDFFYMVEEGEVEVALPSEGDLLLRVTLPAALGGGKSTLRQPRGATIAEVAQHIVKIRGGTTNQYSLCLEQDDVALPPTSELGTHGSDRLNLRMRARSGATDSKVSKEQKGDEASPGIKPKKVDLLAATLERGACFGELAILFGTTRHNAVRAGQGQPVRMLAFPIQAMQVAFAGNLLFPCVALLQKTAILELLNMWSLARVAAAMREAAYNAGEVLLKQGGPSDHLCVVLDGTVRENGQQAGDRKEINVFGEKAVFMPTIVPSQVDVVAETPVRIFRIDKFDLRNVLAREYQRLQDLLVKKDEEAFARQRAWRLQTLENHWLLKHVSKAAKSNLVDAMFMQSAENGTAVICQGQRPEFCYVLEQGTVEVFIDDNGSGAVGKAATLVRTLEQGAVFGDLAFVFGAKRSATVTAKGSVSLQCIPESAFLSALQELQESKDQQPTLLELARFLQRGVPCTAEVGIWELCQMAQTLRRDVFQVGDFVFKQGDVAERFHLLEKGEAKCMVQNKAVSNFTAGEYLSDAVVFGEPQPHSVLALSVVSTFSVDKAAFESSWGVVGAWINNKQILAARAKRLRRKAQVVDEILQSEALYTAFLHTMIDEFLIPLRVILNESQLLKVFSNVEAICEVHDKMSAALDTSRDVGGVLAQFADRLQCYTPYVRNYDEASEVVASLNKTHKGFQKFLADKREHPEAVGGLDLMSYLIMPVQRIPRYRMLLEEVSRFSGPEDPDTAAVGQALAKIKAVALGVNEAKRMFEEEEALTKATSQIVGKVPFPLVVPIRKFVTDLEPVSSANKKIKGVFRLVAFNDLLIVVKQKTGKFKGFFEYSATLIMINQEYQTQGICMIPTVQQRNPTHVRGLSRPSNSKEKEDVVPFHQSSPHAFVFLQTTPEVLQKGKKIVQAATEWIKED